MKILLVGNGTRENRGCEALTISTIEALRSCFPEVNIEVLSFDTKVDKYFEAYGVKVSSLMSTSQRKNYILFRILKKLGLFPIHILSKLYLLTPYVDKLKSVDIVLSLGGDNYTDDYGACELFWSLAMLSEKHNKPFVVWGASVGPFNTKKSLKMARRGLNTIPLITAREDRTVLYLESLGFKGKVQRVYDSAFALSVKSCEIPQFYRKAEVVGFNISPMYHKFTSKTSDEVVLIAKEFVRKISETYNVLLIPHVVKEKDCENDAIYMQTIAEELDNVLPVNPAYNSMELKYIISKCDYFVAARTHATIAAYSSGVPTLALAYSLKASGLNDELFGSDEFLLEAKNFNLEKILDKFNYLVRYSSKARAHLFEKKKVFKGKIHEGVKSLKMFI